MVVNHKKIRRLMREHGLQPKMRRTHIATTDSDHNQPVYPNRAKDLTLDGSDGLWVAHRHLSRSVSASSQALGRAAWALRPHSFSLFGGARPHLRMSDRGTPAPSPPINAAALALESPSVTGRLELPALWSPDVHGRSGRMGKSTHICPASRELSSPCAGRPCRPGAGAAPKHCGGQGNRRALEERWCARSLSRKRYLAMFRQRFVCALMETS
jgi:hypothetical protein